MLTTANVPSKSRIGRRYGWKPSLPNDHAPKYKVTAPVALPPLVESLTAFIPAWDQGQLGSCTGHGNGRLWAHRYGIMKGTQTPPVPSRLFIYYLERLIEGDVEGDNGAQVGTGMQVLQQYGAPPENFWPYDISKFAEQPTPQAYSEALKEQALQFQAMGRDLNSLKQALAQGNPIVFGFTVFSSFESEWKERGMMPLPRGGEQILGGHCVVIDGYDDAKQCFKCMNSWGTSWGGGDGLPDGGFHMPYANLGNCSDFWVLLAIE